MPEDRALPDGYPYPAGQTWLYELRDRQTGKSFCAPDVAGSRLAIPLPGRYDATNNARADATRITFACTSGVMAKCYRWGYRPWLGAEHAAAHQACVRMAMADYCGDGRSWTREATLIQRWDRLSPPAQPRSAPDPRMTFEAAWTPRGAACIAHARWSGLAQEFAPERCAPRLPRCRSEREALDASPDAILFNASARNVKR